MKKRNEESERSECWKRGSGTKGMEERNEENKKADRCGLGSSPLKTGGGTGDGGEGQLVGDDDCH